MDAGIGDRGLPIEQEAVLIGQAGELAALKGVVLSVAHATLDLALVPRRTHPRRQHDRAVMFAERQDLRVEIGIKPIRPGHRGLEVVDHQRLGHAAEVVERVLHAPQEVVGRLAVDRLAVGLP